MQQTKDEEPVTKSSQQKNKKQQTAILGPIRFLFPETLRRQPRLRRSGLGTPSNEVREFHFRGASPSQASTTESSQNYSINIQYFSIIRAIGLFDVLIASGLVLNAFVAKGDASRRVHPAAWFTQHPDSLSDVRPRVEPRGL